MANNPSRPDIRRVLDELREGTNSRFDYTAFTQRMVENAINGIGRLTDLIATDRAKETARMMDLRMRVEKISELIKLLPVGNNWSVREVRAFRRVAALANGNDDDDVCV